MKCKKFISVIAMILAMIMILNVPAVALELVAEAVAETGETVTENKETEGNKSESEEVNVDEELRLPTVVEKVEPEGKLVETDKYSKTYKTGEMTYNTVFSEVPNYYESGLFGRDKEYDNTLVLKDKILADDYYKGTSTDIDVKLPVEISEDNGVTFEYNGVKITMTPVDGDYSKSATLENAILYNDVFDGVDVQYSLYELGLKEDIILNKYVDLTSFSYTLDAHGDKAVLEDGVINVYKEKDTMPSYTIAAPIMIDADGNISDRVRLEYKDNVVTVLFDTDWISSLERSFPIKIDPNITITHSDMRMRMTSQLRGIFQGLAYGMAGYIVAENTGIFDTDDFGGTRMVYDFPKIADKIPQGATINSATFSVFQYTNLAENTIFESRMLTAPWTVDDITWSKVCSITGEPTGEKFTDKSRNGYHNFDVTNAVGQWVAGTSEQYGIVIKAQRDDMGGSAFFTPYSFAGQNVTYETSYPILSIEWELPYPVDANYGIDDITINLRTIGESSASGKLQFYGVFADGLATPNSTVNYKLNDSSKKMDGSINASYSKLFPNSTYFDEHFPDKATKYNYHFSNWQTIVPFTNFDFDTTYYYTANATKDGKTGKNVTSDKFLVYKVKQFDTISKIANYYGTTYEKICVDNRAIDGLVVENNTLVIINPIKNLNSPYNPGKLSENDKQNIDSMLMGRGLHCEFGYEPVNLNTGNFYMSQSDVPEIIRSYNSKGSALNGIFGRGWSFEFDEMLSLCANGAISYRRGDGSILKFVKNSDGTYTAPDGYYLTLSKIQTKTGVFEELDGTKTTYPIYEYEICDNKNTVKHFNSIGLLTKVTDENNYETVLTYDKDYSLKTMTTPYGRTYTFEITADGYISKIVLPNGKALTYSYDSNNNLTSFVDANGNETKYFYDKDHRMTSYKDANGNTVNANVYDSEGRVVKQTDGNGDITTFNYSEGKTVVVDANGNITAYDLDENYRTTKITYDDGSFEEKSYDKNNNLASETDCNGNKIIYTYDSNGNVLSMTRSIDGASKSFKYNSDNKVTKATDFDGKVTTFTYNENKDLVKETYNDGTFSEYEYNNKHQVVKEINALGSVTEYAYSGLLLSSVKDALGGTIKYYYDSMGNLVSTEDKNGNITRYTYDAMGRKLSEQLPNGAVTRYTFDAAGSVLSIADPKGYSYSFTYDAIGNMLSSTDNEGNKVTYTYDGLYNKVSEKDALGNVTKYTYDCKSNIVSKTDALGNVFTFEYDNEGNLIRDDKTTYEYDLRFEDAKSSVKQTLSNAQTVTYSKVGLITKEVDKAGAVTAYTYDNMNRVESISYPTGLKTTYSYDTVGNIVSEVNNSGLNNSYEYDALGQIVKTTQSNGSTLEYSYDKNGNLLSITDELGFVTKYTYNSLNLVSTRTDALGHVTKYEYDLNGNLIKTTDANDAVTIYEYNSYDLVSKVIDANGNATLYAYDANENLIAMTNALGNTMTFSYNKVGLVSKNTDYEGNEYKFSYDKFGNNTKIVSPNGAVLEDTFDLEGRVVNEKAANGLETTYTFNEKGQLSGDSTNAGANNSYIYDKASRLIAATNAKEATISYTYDLNSNVTLLESAMGKKTLYKYDVMYNLVSETNALGEETTYEYNARGDLVSVNDNGSIYTYEVDALGNVVSITNPKHRTRNFTYDSVGNLVAESDYKGNEVSYGYDLMNNLISTTNRRGVTTEYTYDAIYNVTNIKDPVGREIAYTYTKNGNLSSVKEGGVVTANYKYDTVGNLTSYVNGNGNETTYAYDLVGNQVSIKDPLSNISEFEYNLNSQIAKVKNADGTSTEYAYDVLGQLTENKTENTKYNYDADGYISSMEDIFGKTTFETDALGRLVKETLPNGTSTIEYTYSKLGDLTKLQYPNGMAAKYDYDYLDQIIGMTDISGNSVRYLRDENENITEVIRANDSHTYLAYDEDDNVVSVKNIKEYKTLLGKDKEDEISLFEYEYDLSGMIVKETITQNGNTTERFYSYDDRCQVAMVTEKNTTNCGKTWSLTDTVYTYDNAGNCLSEVVKKGENTLYKTAYEYNEADQLTVKTLTVDKLKAITKYSYDKNGNLIKEVNSYNMEYASALKCIELYVNITLTKGTKTYEYDNENRLVATYENGTLVQAIMYDGAGNRAYTLEKEIKTTAGTAEKVFNSCSTSGKNHIEYDKSIIKQNLLSKYGINAFNAFSYELTGYVVDLTKEYSEVLLEYGSNGAVTNVYDYGNGRNSAIINGISYSYLYDGRGSVSQLTDKNGNTAISYAYNIYGKTFASNNLINNPYQYNAEYTDSSTGLQYLRARYYNPSTHRFQSKDTFQGYTNKPITRNSYAYVGNNPINFVDPSGNSAKEYLGYFVEGVKCIPSMIKNDVVNAWNYVKETPNRIKNKIENECNRIKEDLINAKTEFAELRANDDYKQICKEAAKDTLQSIIDGALNSIKITKMIKNADDMSVKQFCEMLASKSIEFVGDVFNHPTNLAEEIIGDIAKAFTLVDEFRLVYNSIKDIRNASKAFDLVVIHMKNIENIQKYNAKTFTKFLDDENFYRIYTSDEEYYMYCLNLDYGNALKNAPGYLDIYEENYEINLNDATKKEIKAMAKNINEWDYKTYEALYLDPVISFATKDAPSIVEFGVLS